MFFTMNTNEVAFDVWMSNKDAEEFQSVLRSHGLTVSSAGPLLQRSPFPSDTVIVAVSGVIYSVAKAFTAYFQSKEKCIKVSDLETTFYLKNYTLGEVARIAKAGNHIVITEKVKDHELDDS